MTKPIDLLAEALRCWDGRGGPPRDPCNRHLGELGFQRCPACQMRDRLRERGVHLVTVELLARALCRRDDTPPGLGLGDMPGDVRASYLYNAEAILAALEEEA